MEIDEPRKERRITQIEQPRAARNRQPRAHLGDALALDPDHCRRDGRRTGAIDQSRGAQNSHLRGPGLRGERPGGEGDSQRQQRHGGLHRPVSVARG